MCGTSPLPIAHWDFESKRPLDDIKKRVDGIVSAIAGGTDIRLKAANEKALGAKDARELGLFLLFAALAPYQPRPHRSPAKRGSKLVAVN